ncbi:transcriptional regulator [Candidatus Wolfebacteria bacterium]|nr:MAG: transcriptional regulator [Candidatus Wolfebacteria bacterium]
MALVLQFSAVFMSNAAQAATKIGIVVFEGVLTSDVTAPIEVFGAATKKSWFSSYEVVVISVDKKVITTEEGLKIVADATIKDDLDLDVLILPSAYDMDPLLSNKSLINFIKKHGNKASWVGTNCSGSSLLAKSGIADGRKITTWAGGEKDLQASFPKVTVLEDINYVVDGKFVTSNGGPVSYEGAYALLALMSSKENAKEIAEYMMFNRVNSKSKAIY